MAPEVGFVGASRCFLGTYDHLFSVGQDNFFILRHYLNHHIQDSLLKLLLTAKFRIDLLYFSGSNRKPHFFSRYERVNSVLR